MNTRLSHARAQAREERARLGGASRGLFTRLVTWLADHHEIDLVPVDKDGFLKGSRGEIVPGEGSLYYDQQLDGNADELFEVVAHEYAHLVLHHDQFSAAAPDLIRGSAFLNSGAPALSRYSPRSEQEAEASAFAAEFICPAGELFTRWRSTATISVASLASDFSATPSLIRQQLAEGLYNYVIGDAQTRKSRHVEQPATPEQERAATACHAPVLVDAGPGTGKTKTLIRRIQHLVQERNVSPANILVLTFSNEAAAELQERIQASLGNETGSRLLTLTFHGFGMVLLDMLGHHIALDVDFSIIDEICQEEMISEILGRVDCEPLLDIKQPERTAAEVVGTIAFLKDRLVGPAELRRAIERWTPDSQEQDSYERSRALLRIFEEYEKLKTERHQVDFADLIRVPYELLRDREDIRDEIRNTFRWVLIDEYQDVSRATALFLQQICGLDNPPWVVGDARQAIYRFRGAAPENMRQFEQEFPKAQTFQLSENYRSAPEIINAINRLAAWLDDPKHQGPAPVRWKPGRDIASLGKRPVLLAIANSDAAERQGVVASVQQWLSAGVPAEQIAVLARRNVDVRNLAIDLKKNGVRAVTSGLLTAEGAGGDMAAVLTVIDHQQAIPRLAYSLYRRHAPPQLLNAAVQQLLGTSADEQATITWTGPPEVQRLAAETWRVFRELSQFLHSGDGWTVLCEYLFFQTSYVRELLTLETDVESAVQLEEVLSALSLAASYRFGHPHVRPRSSRLGLAERMRDLVTESAPGLVAPRIQTGAVRVMTCHASKGLEFPCVAVAGQSLPEIPPPKPSLPPNLRRDKNEDTLQADSLLFVGLSRAERAAVVSFASSARGRPQSRFRKIPGLLDKLRVSGVVPVVDWTAAPSGGDVVSLGRIWGAEAPAELSTYSLTDGTCELRTYLEEHLRARFRGRVRALYPEFMTQVRQILRRIVRESVQGRRSLSESDAVAIAEQEWPPERQKDHPHFRIYRPRALRWARKFARAFDPRGFAGEELTEEPFEWVDSAGVKRTIKLQLIAQVRDSNGDRIAIALQVGPPAGSAPHVNWSEIKDYERLPFVLLHDRHGDLRPMLFFGEEDRLYPFKWSRNKAQETIRKRAEDAKDLFLSLSSGTFEATLDDWVCDRCRCRTICPAWMGAIPTDSTTKL